MISKFKGFLLSALVAFVVVGCTDNKAVFNVVAKASEEMNKRCPMVIDADTRLDNTMAMENPVKLVYYYTIITAEKKAVEAQLGAAKEAMMANVEKTVNSNPEMKFYQDKQVPLTYSYKDKNGEFLFDLGFQR
ncbi:MAG: hypothetical protein V4581_13485 [Bacteroidota bacterium]